MADRLNIRKAIRKPGAFTAQARRHGMGVQAFARFVRAHPEKFDTRTKRRAALAITLARLARRRRRRSRG